MTTLPALIARVHAAHYGAHVTLPEITDDTAFEDIGFDGLDMSTLEMEIADHMGIEIGDAIETAETVGELARIVGRVG